MAAELSGGDDGDDDGDDKPVATRRSAPKAASVLARATAALDRYAAENATLSKRLAALEARERRNDVRRSVEDAIESGKIPPAARDELIELGAIAPKRVKALLAKLPEGSRVSLGREHSPMQLGHSGPASVPTDAESAKVLRLFGNEKSFADAAKSGSLDRFGSFAPMKLGE
jgi:hypothetical protein